jgi:hypothetical protein
VIGREAGWPVGTGEVSGAGQDEGAISTALHLMT